MKNTRLYLDNWNYNSAFILQEIENIILNNGGAIVSTFKTERETYTITNRSLNKAIHEIEERHVALEKHEKFSVSREAREKLEKYKAIDNSEKTIFYGEWNYICFVLNGDYYNISFDRNPFFDFHLTKIRVIDGTIAKNHYSDLLDKKDWLFDCFFGFDCNHSDRKEAANIIVNKVLKARYSSSYRDKYKRGPEKLNVLAGEKTW